MFKLQDVVHELFQRGETGPQRQLSLLFLREQTSQLPEKLQGMCRSVIEDERFQVAYGAKHIHHAYIGGLLDHTAEVLRLAIDLGRDCAATDILITAAIFHDCHKIYEYELVDGEIQGTRYRDMIRHLSGGYAEFICAARTWDLDWDLQVEIGHCILSHHGRKEWGSPVEPLTMEAFILHSADMMSMKGEW